MLCALKNPIGQQNRAKCEKHGNLFPIAPIVATQIHSHAARLPNGNIEFVSQGYGIIPVHKSQEYLGSCGFSHCDARTFSQCPSFTAPFLI